ncbi:DUF3429 domain-containing protein [Oryzifoliimicrobium ureilyticus]|uniref:DUF3429 domain-containing protein n=1 Tax=Oryzifoliimicrobium ureilyticus TaxID=3113724 RepID=UPI0030767145
MTHPATKSVSAILTIAGAAPFILLLSPHLPLADAVLPDHETAFLTYGAIIAAFMAGALWGLSQTASNVPIAQLVVSNILALVAWASLLLPRSYLHASLAIQLASFLGLLAADLNLRKAGLEASWYIKLRLSVTAIVAAAYCAAFLYL